MSDLFLDRSGVYIETVSLGKGYVNWKVHFPTLAKRLPGVKSEYDDLIAACKDVKRFLRREEVDPETVTQVEQHYADGKWGADRD